MGFDKTPRHKTLKYLDSIQRDSKDITVALNQNRDISVDDDTTDDLLIIAKKLDGLKSETNSF